MHPDVYAAIERKSKAYTLLRLNFSDLLRGPDGVLIAMILRHIEPYYTTDPVAATPEQLLTADILALLGLLQKATAAPQEIHRTAETSIPE